MTEGSLENNKNDFTAAFGKSILGAVPFVGSALSEIVGNVIPNQRIDRLIKYVKILDEKLNKIPTDKINEILNNENFIALVEEGFFQAARAITDERREYIASIVANGITDEDIEFNESTFLLKILSELNDIEIVILYSFIYPHSKDFREKHQDIIYPAPLFSGADEHTVIKSTLKKSYKEHLVRLELIVNILQGNNGKIPEFDLRTGKPKTTRSEITFLGRLLLKQIGLIDHVSKGKKGQ